MAAHKKNIVIIGAGPGGLAAGLLLAHRGNRVTIYEKNGYPGGRTSSIKENGYTFDVGPTFFMMDFVLRDIFKQTGRSLDDYVTLTRLSPMYRLDFGGKHLDVYDDDERMTEELRRVFPGEEKGLKKFRRVEAQRLARLLPVLSHHNNSWADALSARSLRSLPWFAIGRSLYGVLGDYFTTELARLSFTFQAKYLGMSPWECPGAFAMVPYVEHAFGIYHARGGLAAISDAMAQVVHEAGGTIAYNAPVDKLWLEGKSVRGVILQGGEKVPADDVIVNADFGHAMEHLVPEGVLRTWSPEKLKRKKLSCSIFMLYLGVRRTTDLRHHTIVFANAYKKNVDDIFNGALSENDFSLYVRDAAATDPSLAPPGSSALYVLVPVPNNRSDIDWQAKAPALRKQALKILSDRLGLHDLEKDIEFEKIITPADWERTYQVYKGAVFNLAHNLGQMLWMRPHNKFEELDHCYLVGGGTHPGSGLPTIYRSGEIAADLISQR